MRPTAPARSSSQGEHQIRVTERAGQDRTGSVLWATPPRDALQLLLWQKCFLACQMAVERPSASSAPADSSSSIDCLLITLWKRVFYSSSESPHCLHFFALSCTPFAACLFLRCRAVSVCQPACQLRVKSSPRRRAAGGRLGVVVVVDSGALPLWHHAATRVAFCATAATTKARSSQIHSYIRICIYIYICECVWILPFIGRRWLRRHRL